MKLAQLDLANVNIAVADGVGWIRLNRPPVNAIDLDLLLQLNQAIQAARVDSEVRVAVLASQSSDAFCTGLDIGELDHFSDIGYAERIDQLFKEGVVRAMRTSRKIFIAMIGGHCLGGGLELALAADFRIASRGTWQIGLPEVRLGGMPGGGGIQLLSRLVGQSRALRLAALGESLGSEEAHAMGLLDALHPEAALIHEVETFARKFTARSGHSIGAIKMALYEGQEMSLADAMVFERQLYRAILMGDDIKEGLAAYREKRRPQFNGE